jgi:uridine kinase
VTRRPDPAAVVARALAAPPRLAATRLVCIDGPAGSGKTTLATDVVDAATAVGLTSAVLHLDDFYEGWSGLDTGVESRLLPQVLEPLFDGQSACWQRYNWAEGRFDAWIDLPVVELLVIEGCGSGALAYAPYRTLLVWVEAARETRIERGRTRDGEEVLPHWLAWMESEDRHFAANATREHADLRYETD